MALLAGAQYDPTTAVTKATSALLAMTAIDTTNLRLSFQVPANGSVVVRLRGTVHGATTFPQILLGVLQGATVIGRQVPMGALKTTAVATAQLAQEASFVVSGLTPGANLTWDAAYGVEVIVASTGLKYGGPNTNAGNNAFGAFVFEVWEAGTLLDACNYDPSTAATKATSALLALTAFDTTNLRCSFTVPPSGQVWWRMRCALEGATTLPVILLGVLDGATIQGRQSPVGGILGTAVTSTRVPHEASGIVTGLTPGANLNWDAAYAVQVLLASTNIKYGGPNNTTADDAWGGFAFEVWSA